MDWQDSQKEVAGFSFVEMSSRAARNTEMCKEVLYQSFSYLGGTAVVCQENPLRPP